MKRFAFASVFLLLLALAFASLPPDLDETYYWTWSRALAWSYYDHPPAVAWAIALATKAFGSGLFGLRAVSMFSMVVVGLCTVASVQRLVPADQRFTARRLALLSLLGAPMFTLGYLPATPDPLQGAAVALAAWLVVRKFDLAASFVLVSSLLIKHSTALLLVGALPFLSRRSWGGTLLGALFLIPWCFSDGSTSFQLQRVFASDVRGPIAIPMTIGSMMGTLGPVTACLLFVLPFLSLPRTERALAMGAFVLAIACIVSVWFGAGEANWPMPAMVFALPAAIGFVVRTGGRILAIASFVARTSAFLMLLALVHVVHPWVPIAPERDRTLRSAGFAEVARVAAEVAADVGAEKLIARRYQIASELRYHLQDELPVHELGTSRKSQYDRWPRPSLCRGEAAVLVVPSPDLPPDLDAERIAPARPIVRHRGQRSLDTYWVTPVRMRADRGPCR